MNKNFINIVFAAVLVVLAASEVRAADITLLNVSYDPTNGATGAIGPSGGVKGDAGAAGAAGVKGDTGLTGLTGPAGSNGTAGVKGDTGAAGAIGPIGLTGPAGAAGTGGSGSSAAIHLIGDSYAGGIVFWVDASGEHGLIAARADQSAGIGWFNGKGWKLTGTNNEGGAYAGAMNTALIVAQLTADTAGGNFAAKVAADYSVQDNGITACTGAATEICYGDWYLPSMVELMLLYTQKTVVGGFANQYYWASMESGPADTVCVNFGDGLLAGRNKGDNNPVRSVRAF